MIIQKIFAIISFLLIVIPGHAQISIAVMELRGEGLTPSEASILTDRLRIELFNTGKFKVIERELMDEILNEQGFQLSDCSSDECIVEIGRVIGVQNIIGGQVGKFGELYTISSRLIDVETGEILRTATEDMEGPMTKLLTHAIKYLAQKLAQDRIIEEPKELLAQLRITTVPSGAYVNINQIIAKQRTPLTISDISPGTHQIEIRKKGFQTISTSVTLEAGDTVENNYMLVPVRIQKSRTQQYLRVPDKKLRFNLGFIGLFGAMKEYNSWIMVVNKYILEPDDKKKISKYPILSGILINCSYKFHNQLDAGLSIGYFGGKNTYRFEDEFRGDHWYHEFAISNIYFGTGAHYYLMPSGSAVQIKTGAYLLYLISTIKWQDIVDFGYPEWKSTLKSSGICPKVNMITSYRISSNFSVNLGINYQIATLSNYSGDLKKYLYGNQTESYSDAYLYSRYGNYRPFSEADIRDSMFSSWKKAKVTLGGLIISGGISIGF